MKNVTFCILLVITALMAAGCGKFHTCTCWSGIAFDIVDTALADSVQAYPLATNLEHRESTVECSYWSYQDTVGHYMPEYGIRTYGFIDCGEK